MAKETQSAGNVDFLKIFDGKFSQSVKEGVEDAKERINKEGKKVFEKFYEAISGFITSIKVEPKTKQDGTPLGNFLIIRVKDGAENNQIEINTESGYATDFLDRFENLDLQKKMRLVPIQMDKDNGKKKYFLVPYQEDSTGKSVKVEKFYTKENPGAPMGKEVNKGTKAKPNIVWDFTENQKWYSEYIERVVEPKMIELKAWIELQAAE